MRPKHVNGSTHNAVQVITRYMCRFCGQQFHNISDMQSHTQVHFSEKPPHACYVCGRTYRTPSKLQRHVRVHSGERPYACSICGKRFTRSDHVKQHLKVHMPQRQKNVCRLCGMRFMRRQTLQVHLRSHGIVQVFSCNRCGEAFESALQLHHHKETHSSVFYGQGNDGLDAEGGLPFIKREPGEEGEELSRPILGLAKFGLGPQPYVKEDVDGQVSEKSYNPVALAKQALDLALKAQEEPEYSDDKPSQANGHTEEDDEKKSGTDMEEDMNDDEERDTRADGAAMSISNCFSLASGDNSVADVDLKDLEEVSASTFSDGMKMILIPSDMADDDKSNSNDEDDDEKGKTSMDQENREEEDEDKAEPEVSKDILVSSTAEVSSSSSSSKSSTVCSILPKPPPIIPAGRASSSNPSSLYSNMRSLLTSASAPGIRPARPHPPLLCMGVPGLSSATAGGKSSGYLFGKKMIRCDHCCMWFEDHSMSLLHMSLHSADPSDPFTCRKCLKRLGNRLEFMAHIVWHLDPCMEEKLLKNS